jgi:hypothetical protein
MKDTALKALACALAALSMLASAQKLQYRSADDIDLPPISQRKIIGTWMMVDSPCTRSFEEVKGEVYDVARCNDKSGGNTGRKVARVNATAFRSFKPGSTDHYVIQKDGTLSVRDRDGEIDRLKKHALWP